MYNVDLNQHKHFPQLHLPSTIQHKHFIHGAPKHATMRMLFRGRRGGMGSSAPLWAEFDRTLEMVARMEAGAEQQMPTSMPMPTPLDDWPQWPNDVRAYYPDGEGRFYEMY